MTSPLTGGGSAWPIEPTMPSAAPAGYVAPGALPEAVREPPMTSGQIEAKRNQFFELILQRVVEALTGFFSKAAGSAFNQLVSWAGSVGSGLGTIFQNIVNTVTGVLGNPLSFLENILHTILSPLNALNIFGVLQPHQTASVTGGAVSATPQNLISEGSFRDAATVVAGQGWSWDGTQGRTIPGSLKVVADGAENSILSNQIPVVANTELDFAVQVKWSGLTYTGTDPIVLGVTGYSYDPLTKMFSELDSVDLETIASPATSGGWLLLSASYVAPPEGSLSIPDGVRMRLKIGGNVSAGSVWFDEASAMKAVLVTDNVVPGIGTTLDSIVNGLENLTGGDWTHDEAFQALFGQNAATISLATRVALLESLQTPGASTIDAFERTSSTNLGANWTMDYSGGGGGILATPNGSDASWINSGTGTRLVFAKLTTGMTDSTGDDQRVQAVLGSKAVHKFFNGLPPVTANGSNILICRMSSDRQNAILAYFRADGLITIQRFLAGVATTIGTTTLSTGPSAGSTIGLICGPGRNFQAVINSAPVLTCSDATSGLGAPFRGWGFGMRAEGYTAGVIWPPPFVFSGQAAPGRLNSWGGFDA